MTYEEQILRVNEKNPYMKHNGIRAVSLTAEKSVAEAVVTGESRNAMGSVHGGLMFTLAEIAAGLLARNEGKTCVTLDTSFRYLRGSRGEKDLIAEASFVKNGRSIIICRAAVKEKGEDKLLAEGEFTFFCTE